MPAPDHPRSAFSQHAKWTCPRHVPTGFRSNKGYSVPEHLRALKEHGPCPEHRRSFRPERFQEELKFEAVA